MRTGIVVAALVVACAAPLGASAASRVSGCTAKGATVVARAGTALLLSAPVGPDDEYGPGTRVMTCRQGHPRVTLASTGPGDALTITHPVFAPAYVAFAWTRSSVACSKYLGDDPQCTSARVASYNRRTGRTRVSGTGPADALAVTTSGWLAWVSPLDASGARTLTVADRGGERVLDRGAIDPASLRANGQAVTWTANGAAASAGLG